MTDRELMQMALEALEAMQSYARAEKKGLLICDEAIEALRERLAQPDREWVGLTDEDKQEFAAAQHGWEELCAAIEAKLKEKNNE